METSAQSLLIVAEIHLIYKTKVKASDRPKVTSARQAYEIFHATWDMDKIEFVEQFKILFLNRNNKVLGIYEASTGGTAGTVADIKLIFASALKANAHFIIIAHNHPSGNLNPSESDARLTEQIKNAGKILEVHLIDHLIITAEGYYSFSDAGSL